MKGGEDVQYNQALSLAGGTDARIWLDSILKYLEDVKAGFA